MPNLRRVSASFFLLATLTACGTTTLLTPPDGLMRECLYPPQERTRAAVRMAMEREIECHRADKAALREWKVRADNDS